LFPDIINKKLWSTFSGGIWGQNDVGQNKKVKEGVCVLEILKTYS
jgi:hypothetical protein